MRSVLFSIPLDGQVDLGPLGRIPVFGMGLLLAVWCLAGIVSATLVVRRRGWKSVGPTVVLVWAAIAVALFKAGELAIKTIPVYGYGMMLFFGFLTSASLAARRLRQEGADGEIAWDAAMWIFLAGLLGGRTFYVIQYRDKFFGPDAEEHARTAWQTFVGLINLPDGGLVLYGGLFFAPLALYLFCRRRKIRALVLADIAITSVFVGVMFGRLGCLLHGCCYGDVCSLPWAVTFPAHSVPFEALVARGLLDENAPHSLPLHPSQLYDSLSAFLLALMTWAYYPHRRGTGDVLALGWIAYPINRFMIEFLRSDEAAQLDTGLTIAQLVSLGLFATGVAFCLFLRFRSVGRLPLVIAPAKQAKAEPPLPGAKPQTGAEQRVSNL
jgi:phosphatidylglycerol:prolipoprotein diacylglycerol transferase